MAEIQLIKPHREATPQGNDVGAAHHFLHSNENVTSWTFVHVLEATMTGVQSSKSFCVQTCCGPEPKARVTMQRTP